MTNLKKKTASTDEKRRAYAISGTYKEADAPKVKAILTLLQKISGDASLEMVDIEEGSIRLILEGSTEGLEQLEALFKSGELTEVEGIPVEDVSFVSSDTSESGGDIKTSGKKRLAFTIAGSVAPADIAKLKAEITQASGDDDRTEYEELELTGETSSKDEEAIIAEKPRLFEEILTQKTQSRNRRGAYLRGADLSQANLRGAYLRGADLSQADLSQTNLSQAKLSQADLSQAKLSQANLIDAYLRGADLRGADLRGADLRSANLSYADLIDAYLRGADLSYADLSYADLSRANLIDADLIDANLSRANLINAYLRGAYLRGADLSHANLSRANLIDAYLRGANLRGTNLINANLSHADLSDANLRGASLSDAKLIQADLRGADLRYANLIHTDLICWIGAKVNVTRFGSNLGISEHMKLDLIRRGAIFEDFTGDHARSFIPVPR
ncbi:MAG: pentapeptide repeat-containing protein [Symploca sp. SIO2D2]|nr:pentapeptide repeat-containing protein [Symploca sp. SIO2D2]